MSRDARTPEASRWSRLRWSPPTLRRFARRAARVCTDAQASKNWALRGSARCRSRQANSHLADRPSPSLNCHLTRTRRHHAKAQRRKRAREARIPALAEDANGRSEATVDIAAAAIERFEAHVGYRAFKSFRREQAISFKAHLGASTHPTTGKPLSKATLYGTLKSVQAFFVWLERERGYRSHIHVADAGYFRPTDNDARIAPARRDKASPSLEQLQHVIATMPRQQWSNAATGPWSPSFSRPARATRPWHHFGSSISTLAGASCFRTLAT